MTRNALLLFAALPFLASAAQDAALSLSAMRERYPDADAVLVEGVECIEYNADGTYVADSTNVVKVLTEKGRREESEIALSFNARYAEAKVLSITVEGEDGSVRDVDFAATAKETTDNSSMRENIYDPMSRKLVCTVPGVKVGDTVRFATRRSAFKARVENQYSDLSVLEWTCPILRQSVVVKAPAGRPVRRSAVRNPIGNVEYSSRTLDDGSVIHMWTATNSPQAFAEPNSPPLYTLLQNVRFSTAESWEEISRWYWGISLPHLEKANAGITNRVAEIVSALPPGATDGDRIAAVFKWVSQEIRYMGLTMEDTSPGYAPHDVDITFDNRYGVCRDKAALLAAMLRIAGFDAYPVLIHTEAKMDKEVPLPYFNHAIAAVRAPGAPEANADGFILMDPTNESSADLLPAYLGDRSYIVATPEGEPLHVSPVRPASGNSVSIESRGTLERDGSLVVDGTIRFAGLDDNAYRSALLRMKPDIRRRLFERIVRNSASGSAELLAFELSPADLHDTATPLSARILYRVDEAVVDGETRDELTVPFLSRAVGSSNWILAGDTSLARRRFPLAISATAMTSERIEVELKDDRLGDGVMPDAVTIEGPYAYSRSYTLDGSVLVASRSLAVNAVEFSPEEYLDLRENVKRAEAADRPRPVFSGDAIAGASVRVISDRTAYALSAPDCWVATNWVEKEILTYEGKKKSSELKFRFNPAWQNVEVLYATVSNANGKVVSAGERETTLFDAGWAASAPRYPASKQLVVNLPSVEIGSVLRYAVASSATNAPAPFYAQWRFDSSEPLDFASVSLTDWTGASFSREVSSPRRLRSEPMQPDSSLWRDVKTVAYGCFSGAAKRLRAASDPDPVSFAETDEAAAKAATPEDRILAVRNWMSKHVTIAGPGLYELPLELQTTDPEKVLEERYASRLDYVRTLCALLKGLGFRARVVYSSGDAWENPAVASADAGEFPDIAKFSLPLCRVDVEKGGFLGFGARRETFFVGAENEYAPLGPSSSALSRYLDPEDGDEPVSRTVGSVAAAMLPAEKGRYSVEVRENGSVDVDFEREIYGSSVGPFRKKYAEMLPEDRSRHFEELLGALAQAAEATRELSTDVEGYPARIAFSAYIPDYATVSGDTMSIVLPGIGESLFPLTGTVRETPLGIPARSSESTVETCVRFPAGYVAEHLPSESVFSDPSDPASPWRTLSVSSSVDGDGRLVVKVVQTESRRRESMLPSVWFALLKDWSRIASSRANRTIVVRRAAK